MCENGSQWHKYQSGLGWASVAPTQTTFNIFWAVTGHLHLPQETLKPAPPHHFSNTLLGRCRPCQYLSGLEVGSDSGSHLKGPTEYPLWSRAGERRKQKPLGGRHSLRLEMLLAFGRCLELREPCAQMKSRRTLKGWYAMTTEQKDGGMLTILL